MEAWRLDESLWFRIGVFGLIVCCVYGVYLDALDRRRVRDLGEKHELVFGTLRQARGHLAAIPRAAVHEVRSLYFLGTEDSNGTYLDLFGPDPNASRTLRVPVRHIVVLLETMEALGDLQRRFRRIYHLP